MSKSYRKPYGTFCSFKNSARKDKQTANRGVRRKQDSWLRGLEDFDAELVPHRYECCHNDVWGWNRDGNQYLMKPSIREWNDHLKYLSGEFDSEFNRRWAEKYDSVWPPAWYVDLQRK